MLMPALLTPARQLTPQEALNRLGSDHRGARGTIETTPALTVKAADGLTGLYVFNTGREGYMIVSADDCALPLLGYSDKGSFNPNNIPPQLRGWLDFYARQIAWASKKGVRAAAADDNTATDYPAISPMIKTQWDQDAPYNDDCPSENGQKCVTGCVATAMAQAMYYHQWPATGKGSNSYTWNGQTLSMDFASTTFDWADMTLTYGSGSSTAADAAVATLMYACGVGVNMNYSPSESAATSMDMLNALYNYFDYDKSMTNPQRSYYGSEEWNALVYDQLNQGMPVLYAGQSDEGGHQFICDGYDGQGYFHFNWGWSGLSDGYYLLSALDPLEQGIGGSGSDAGFNYDQNIVVNLKPASSSSTVSPLIYCYGNFSVYSSNAQLGEETEFNTDYYNFGIATVEGNLGLKVVAADGSTQYISGNSTLEFEAYSGYGGFIVTLPSDLADGTYTVSPAFKMEGSSEWSDVRAPLSGVQSLKMVVADGNVTFSDILDNQPQVTDFTLNSPIYLNEDFSSSFTLTNNGTKEYYGEYVLLLLDSQGNEVAPSQDVGTVDLQPGQSVSVSYISSFPSEVENSEGQTSEVSAGQYYLALVSYVTGLELYQYPDEVTVNAAPSATSLKITSFSINDGNEVVDSEDVKFSGTAECTEGYFGGQLKIAVFKQGETETQLTGSTGYLFIASGSQADFETHVDVTSADSNLFFAVVYNGSTQLSGEYNFEIMPAGVVNAAEMEGVSFAVTTDAVTATMPAPVATARVYAIDGTLLGSYVGNGSESFSVPVGELGSGLYIVTVADTAGNVASKAFVK